MTDPNTDLDPEEHWAVKDHDNDAVRAFDSRKEAEDAQATAEDFDNDASIYPPGEPVDGTPLSEQEDPPEQTDLEESTTEIIDGDDPQTEVIDSGQAEPTVATPRLDLDDPEANLPGWMLSEITHGNGETGIDLNKNGTQVVAGALGFEVTAEAEITAKETDYEYCRYRATVTRPDGRTFDAVGDCHIEEQGKSKWDLERQAETRAKKRAVKWAAAGGIEALGT